MTLEAESECVCLFIEVGAELQQMFVKSKRGSWLEVK